MLRVSSIEYWVIFSDMYVNSDRRHTSLQDKVGMIILQDKVGKVGMIIFSVSI